MRRTKTHYLRVWLINNKRYRSTLKCWRCSATCRNSDSLIFFSGKKKKLCYLYATLLKSARIKRKAPAVPPRVSLSGSTCVWLQTPWQSKPRCRNASQSHRSGRHRKDWRPEGLREVFKTLNLTVFLAREAGKGFSADLHYLLLHIPTGVITFVKTKDDYESCVIYCPAEICKWWRWGEA